MQFVKQSIQRLGKFIFSVISRFQDDSCIRHALALSYSSLLALAPMVAIIFSMFSLFSAAVAISEGMEDFIYRHLIPTAGDEVPQYLE